MHCSKYGANLKIALYNFSLVKYNPVITTPHPGDKERNNSYEEVYRIGFGNGTDALLLRRLHQHSK